MEANTIFDWIKKRRPRIRELTVALCFLLLRELRSKGIEFRCPTFKMAWAEWWMTREMLTGRDISAERLGTI